MACAAVLYLMMFSSCGGEKIEEHQDRAERPRAIQRAAVPSTVIPTVGYDASQRTLEIEFHNGAVYQYFDVPQYVYEDLKDATDPAKYFNQHIRKADYKYRQVAVDSTAAETAGLRNSNEYKQDH